MKKNKISGTLRLSELLKIGIRYFKPDDTSFWVFNDGTMMWSHFESFTNDSGTSFDDLYFLCEKDGLYYDVIDDVYDTLPVEIANKSWDGAGPYLNTNWQIGE